MKLLITSVFFLYLSFPLFASKTLLGVVALKTKSPQTQSIATILNRHLNNIFNSTDIFEVINPALLNKELKTFNCQNEPGLINFARQAKIGLLIAGSLIRKGDFFSLTLTAYGLKLPYQGKIIYEIQVEIPLYSNFSSREYSYICEEQAGFFVAKMLDKYQEMIEIKNNGKGHFFLDPDFKEEVNGVFRIYTFRNKSFFPWEYENIGSVEITSNKIDKKNLEILQGDFIFYTYKDKAEFWRTFYKGRKKEIIFEKPAIEGTLYKMLFTVPASMTMPIAAPCLGYYHYNDWAGMTLWAINASPYLFLEYRGLDYHLNEKEKPISSHSLTQKRFSYYFFFLGGTSLFVDAFSNQYLKEARNYRGTQPLMGNSFSAVYLSLISGGGGHFYRGHRDWGYFYFHLNNILVYLTLKEFSPATKYDFTTDSYLEGARDKKKAYGLLGFYCFVKTVEIVHAFLIDDSIQNGEIITEGFSFAPLIYCDENYKLSYGLEYQYYW